MKKGRENLNCNLTKRRRYVPTRKSLPRSRQDDIFCYKLFRNGQLEYKAEVKETQGIEMRRDEI